MADSRALYLTTPIYYVNDVPHVGHAYTTIAADAVTRARRLAGREAFLLTGTDEHGQNIERIARERGVSPQEHCDRIAARFKALWERYDIAYDRFIRTTDDVHKRGVLAFWERLAAGPDAEDGQPAVYRGKYAGWYCPRCEAFKTEDELKQPGNLCPDHERPCEWTEEENFFFRLSAYSALAGGRDRVRPPAHRSRGPPQRGAGRHPQGPAGLLHQPRAGEVGDRGARRARATSSTCGWTLSPTTSPPWATPTARPTTSATGRVRRALPPGGQGDHPLPLPLLAGHAEGGGPAHPHPGVRPRPPHEERQEAQQDHGQRHRPRGARGRVRCRRGALLPDARGQLRPGLGLHRPGLRGPLQRRPGQRPRQPGLAVPGHGRRSTATARSRRATRRSPTEPAGRSRSSRPTSSSTSWAPWARSGRRWPS